MVESERRSPARGRHARRRDVRPRADAGRHRSHSLAGEGSWPVPRSSGPRPSRTRRWPSGIAKFIPAITDAYGIAEKQVRYAKIGELKKQCVAELTAREGNTWTPAQIDAEFHDAEKNVVRSRIIAGKPRIDGRDTKTVRKIDVQVGVLPRTHGSAIFTRGETQALVVTTLGTGRDAQIIDALEGERRDPFMLHYNFPPYSVGETGFIGSPKRREIGHGRLARRGVEAVMPDLDTFPYVIRVVSEITESNGSSSMASVCGTSLSLDGRRRADQGSRRRCGHGPHQGRQGLRGAHRHPRRRGSSRRHGLQGRRHVRRRHGAADGHQDLRHHARDHGHGAGAGHATAACTSSAR